ncbi:MULTISPECIES: GGDEF domain-containing protein [unclassified Mycobacterium]|uniref:GGDEF domain-containing protein n=1 Tax=unclassified Mycobacterium TaxID=2642494 RepID=UPI0029C8C69F|nr:MULTISPECIES: GGDEF domain-containing protein [unclassified Mycobacterium]
MGFIGASCVLLAVLGVIVQFHPDGPHGVAARCVQVAVLMSAALVGLRWLLGRWPSHAYAVAYIAWADCALAATAFTMSTPEARVCTTLYMAMLGIFACFILGVRILILHCVFGAAVIGAIVGLAMLSDPAEGFRLFVFYMPALAWVVMAPVGAVILIERGRLAIGRTARSAHYDPLTGLRNRRGMYFAVERTLARRTDSATVVMAVCDVDRFKQLNDQLGHAAGDAALIAMAQQLKSIAKHDEITARIGGDELVLVAFPDESGAVDDLLQRFVLLTRVDVEGAAPTASVGIASNTTDDPHFSVDDVLRHADAAMYEAKRAGGGSCVVYRGPAMASTTAAVADSRNDPVELARP